jgi:SulP family sulfate permease
MIEECGGRTRFANVFFGLFTALALLFLADWLNRIPVSALAGLLLFVGAKLIDLRQVRRVWNTDRADFTVLALTFFVTVFLKVELGLFAGMAAAMVIFLNRARDLRLYELVPLGPHGFEERAYTPDSRHEKSDILVISLQGELFFGVAGALRSQLNEIVRLQEPKYLIVRTRRAHTIDYSCWNTLFHFAERFAEVGGKLYLSGVQPEFVRVIRDTGMQKLLPREQRFAYTGVPMQAMHQTIAEVMRHLPEDAKLSPAWREHLRHLKAAARNDEDVN